MPTETKYNGWKNRQTWNIALWVQNDEPTYRFAYGWVSLRRARDEPIKWTDFLTAAGLIGRTTPDGVKWDDPAASRKELAGMLSELVR